MDKLRQKYAKIMADMRAMIDAAGDDNLTAEQQTQYDALETERAATQAEIDRRSALESAEAEMSKSVGRAVPPEQPKTPETEQRVEIPRAYGRLRAFADIPGAAPANERAYRYGTWLGAIAGNGRCRDQAKKLGIKLRAQTEGTNTAGGFAVPNEFTSDWILLVEQYGVFRRNVDIHPMVSETASPPRQTSDVTIYLVGENAEATESDIAVDQVNLTARKWMGFTKITNELSEDAIVNIADKVMQSHARGYAYKEDDLGFAGDGSGTDGGILGINPGLIAINGVDTGGGMVVSANDTIADMTLAELHSVMGILPSYAEAGAKWYTSRWVFATLMERLAAAAGGSTWENIAAGGPRSFLGYPVELVSGTVFPKADTTSQIMCVFGDLAQSSTLGDRRSMSMRVTETGNDASYDRLSVISSARWDINNHDLGSATVAGPVVCLISAAS